MFKSSKPQSLETYLAQIAHELRGLPLQARADEMREIETHLRAMIESGGDVAGMLAQFGKPRNVGRDLRRAWERKQPESWINLALAFVVGCAFISAHNYFWFNFLDGVLLFFRPSFYYFYVEGFGANAQRFCIYFLSEVLCSLAVGAFIGFLSPKRGRIMTAFIFPFLIMLDFFPLIAIGIGFYWLSFSLLLKYALLFCSLLSGAKFGARFNRKRQIQIAK